MEQAGRKIHKGLSFEEVNQLDADISYIREVLDVVFLLSEPVNRGHQQKVSAIVYEAKEKMDRIEKILDGKD